MSVCDAYGYTEAIRNEMKNYDFTAFGADWSALNVTFSDDKCKFNTASDAYIFQNITGTTGHKIFQYVEMSGYVSGEMRIDNNPAYSVSANGTYGFAFTALNDQMLWDNAGTSVYDLDSVGMFDLTNINEIYPDLDLLNKTNSELVALIPTLMALEIYKTDDGNRDNLYGTGQPISAKLINGTYSKLYCKGYDSEGNPFPLESVGRIKHQVSIIEDWAIQWNQTTDTMTYSGFDFNQVDFDNIYPYSEMRRCNVADDGTVNAYYGDAGFVEDGSNGQVMVEIPMVYSKYELDTSGDRIFTWSFSKYAKDGYEIDPAFNLGTGYASHLYVSAYEGSIYDTSAGAYLLADEQIADFTAGTGDVLSSIANAKPCSGATQQLTLHNARILAQNRGTNWELLDVTAVNLVQKLLISEYASFNSQSVIGKGVVDKAAGTGNESELTGGTSSLGNGTGDAGGTNGLTSVSYRGIENFWGNIWVWIDGINIQGNNILWINPTNENFVSDSFASPYISQGALSNANGYVSNILDTKFGLFATAVTGSSSTYLTDYYYQSTGNRVAALGGGWYSGSLAGCACWLLNGSSASRVRDIGARVCFRKQSTVSYPKSPIRLKEQYPLIMQSDSNDILTTGTGDVKDNRVRAVDDLVKNENNQLFVTKDGSGDIEKMVFYSLDDVENKNSISLLKDVELKSVSDTVRDRVYVAKDGNVYYEKKISDLTAIATATVINTTNYTDAKENGAFILYQDDGTLVADIVDGNTTTTDAGDFIYELAEPEIINLTELVKANGSIQTFQNGTMYLEGFVEESFTTTGTSQVLTEDFAAVSNVYYLDGEVYSKLSSDTWTYTESTKTLSGLTASETYRVEGSPSYFIPPTSTMTYALNTEARDDASASGANENKKEIASLSDALALIIANL